MKKRSFFHTVRVMFPMAFHAAPLRFILINVLGISQSVVMGANTLLLSNFVNELIASVGKGRFEAALIAATAFLCVWDYRLPAVEYAVSIRADGISGNL